MMMLWPKPVTQVTTKGRGDHLYASKSSIFKSQKHHAGGGVGTSGKEGRGGGGDDGDEGSPSTSYDAGPILAAAGKSLESLPEGQLEQILLTSSSRDSVSVLLKIDLGITDSVGRSVSGG